MGRRVGLNKAIPLSVRSPFGYPVYQKWIEKGWFGSHLWDQKRFKSMHKSMNKSMPTKPENDANIDPTWRKHKSKLTPNQYNFWKGIFAKTCFSYGLHLFGRLMVSKLNQQIIQTMQNRWSWSELTWCQNDQQWIQHEPTISSTSCTTTYPTSMQQIKAKVVVPKTKNKCALRHPRAALAAPAGRRVSDFGIQGSYGCSRTVLLNNQ